MWLPSMLDSWAAYCAQHGYDFDVYSRGASIVVEDADYYAEVGFDGLARDLTGYKAQEAPAADFEWNPSAKRLELRKRY